MSVRFNTMGTHLLALRRRLPPILYSTLDQDPICQFYNQDYYNSCTMKSCCFAGANDEYVLSGSDDFNLYIWKVYDADLESRHQWVDKNQMVLYGHRSIVNQVRYNPQNCLLASSGVEKIIKVSQVLIVKDFFKQLISSYSYGHHLNCQDGREVYWSHQMIIFERFSHTKNTFHWYFQMD
jgi:WD40 repeat protein